MRRMGSVEEFLTKENKNCEGKSVQQQRLLMQYKTTF